MADGQFLDAGAMPRSVLILDFDDLHRAILGRVVSSLGHDPLPAKDVETACDHLGGARRIDLVLADVDAPSCRHWLERHDIAVPVVGLTSARIGPAQARILQKPCTARLVAAALDAAWSETQAPAAS